MEKIPLPDTVAVIHEEGNEATFEIHPSYPGYGPTLGNALRRVLLSSLPGTGVTSVRFEGVEHEFSAIPGVAEDVVSILLNIKRLRLKLHADGPLDLRVKASGKQVVTARQIEKADTVEIVNPDQVIARLTEDGAKLDLTLTVARGRGYVPVEEREQEQRPLGTIAVDAIYTPVERVSFRVENVRVGQETEYHKLILTIRTDGTLTPKEALAQAASILEDHFAALASDVNQRLTYRRDLPSASVVGLSHGAPPIPTTGMLEAPASGLTPSKELVVNLPVPGAVRALEEQPRDSKLFPVVELPVSTRIQNILEKEGIRSVAGLVQKTRSQLLGIPGLGEKALEEIEEALKAVGPFELRPERKME